MLKLRALFLGIAVVFLGRTTLLAQAKVGSEFQVNTHTTDGQSRPSVAATGSGNFVVVWTSLFQDADSAAVIGQRYAPNGLPIGSEFQVNTYVTGQQSDARVAPDGFGGFVVAWASMDVGAPQDGSDSGIFGQRYDSAGARAGGEFQISSYTTDYQGEPAIAVGPGGNFVVTWISNGQDGDGRGIFAQRFDLSGAKVGLEFQVNTYTTSNQFRPAVAFDNVSNFVIVWDSTQADPLGQDGSYGGIFGQRFDQNGVRIGGEFQVNTYTTYVQYQPAVATDGSGNFLVVWNSRKQDDGFAAGIYAQRFDSGGAAVGSEFRVNTHTLGEQFNPAVASDGSNFVVTWQSYLQDGSGNGVFGQRLNNAGAPIGSEFQVNTYTTQSQSSPAVAAHADGTFVVAWDSYLQDGSSFGVFGQRFSTATPTITPAPTSTPTPTVRPTPTTPPVLGLERTTLNFGIVKSGSTLVFTTPPQNDVITAPSSWTASNSLPFVGVSPNLGSGTAPLAVSIASSVNLPAAGPTQASVTVNAVGVSNSPQSITLHAQVYAPGTTSAPFGFFDTPVNNATGVAGAIAVTGWALDDIAVAGVKIYRDPVSADAGAVGANGKVFIGDAVFVADARPDVAALYPTMPLNYRAAWGYMLLTNFLPSGANPVGGNGPFTLYAYATDVEGHVTLLGSKTITVDNANATKPFGTIDTPAQGATVSGALDSFGWALTPGAANTIPIDGHTVQVFVDGIQLGTAQYNLPRNDIQTLFPGYTNTNGAIGYFQINTTLLANGVHTIFWVVTDDHGRSDGIGSRFFTVLN
jgi:hypothetical protein